MPAPNVAGTPLTRLQRRVLAFIRSHRRQHGYSPTLRDICRRFSWSSPCSAKSHIDAMKAKGALRSARTARSIVPTDEQSPAALLAEAAAALEAHGAEGELVARIRRWLADER